jgi:hypothetical protein
VVDRRLCTGLMGGARVGGLRRVCPPGGRARSRPARVATSSSRTAFPPRGLAVARHGTRPVRLPGGHSGVPEGSPVCTLGDVGRWLHPKCPDSCWLACAVMTAMVVIGLIVEVYTQVSVIAGIDTIE